jgi:hypothetical protein
VVIVDLEQPQGETSAELVRHEGFVPKLLVTDKLRSYACAFRRLRLTCRHEQGLRKNNRAENSHSGKMPLLWHDASRASALHACLIELP